MIVDVTAGCSRLHAIARWVIEMPESAATFSICSTASNLRWLCFFSGAENMPIAPRLPSGHACPRLYLPVSHPPLSGLHTITPMP